MKTKNLVWPLNSLQYLVWNQALKCSSDYTANVSCLNQSAEVNLNDNMDKFADQTYIDQWYFLPLAIVQACVAREEYVARKQSLNL